MTERFDATLVFCDGACSGNPGPGGWGVVICTPKGEVRELGGAKSPTTNNQMEMTALIQALEFLKGHKEPIRIFTDSVYVLKGITAWVYGWKKRGWKTSEGQDVANVDLWEALVRVVSKFEKKQIIWGYVPGHKGVPGNERVDEIAVRYSKGDYVALYKGPLNKYGTPLYDLPEDTSIPELNYEKREKKVAYSYLSYMNGEAQRHGTWPECEARVKGRSGAKFKKAMSQDEEILILKEWGVELSKLKS